ncbi:Alpha/beta hydrolase fold-1 [Dactylonectria estremocensis]|uniref:Alpha/beta hydrolase fold-1 n=1 Tax=Dactylonectria estremocensis TaxID=1079267 RepID=A0A9P9EMS0_9HYPO|nr:Alpha/beta hydrolase fold-1 [Dactylonectria estremocensis]
MADFVIVPGACTPPALFQDFCDLARDKGVAATTVELATVGRNLDQLAPGIIDDVCAIRQVAEPLLDQGKEVILVTSSLGGVAGTQSLEHLGCAPRALNGRPGGIKKVVYVSSMILEPGTAAVDFFGPEPPPIMNIEDTEEYIQWTDDIDDGTLTFSDLPQEEARKHRAKMTTFHSRHSFENRLTYPGYKHVEVHYVVCEEDRILPKEAQLALVKTLKKHSIGKVTIHSIAAGHLPLVTSPEKTLQILRGIAGG